MPRGEVEIAGSRMHDDSSGIGDSALQGLSIGTIELRDVQVFGVPIEPVQLPADPVDSDTLETQTVVAYYGFFLATAYWGSAQRNIK